jgi:hypothetical protein
MGSIQSLPHHNCWSEPSFPNAGADCKALKKIMVLFNCQSSVDLPKTIPPHIPEADSMAKKEVKSLVHSCMCLHLYKKGYAQIICTHSYLHMDNHEFTVIVASKNVWKLTLFLCSLPV